MTSPSAPYPFPPTPPAVVGTGMIVDRYLKPPTVIQKQLEDFTTQKFIADFLFRTSGADGGSVQYDRASAQDIYVDPDPNMQPGVIEPGMEFPDVNATDTTSLVATVQGYGGQFPVSYVQIRRNNRDIIGRGIRKLGNTLIKQSNNRAIQAITQDSGVVKVAAASPWDGATPTTIADLTAAFGRVDNTDLGYDADTVIINPLDLSVIMGQAQVYNRLPRENAALNPILNKSVTGLLGMNWITSRLQPRGQVIVCQRGTIGAIAEEIPQYTRQVDQPERERWIVMSARWDVPVITDPLAATVITGILT